MVKRIVLLSGILFLCVVLLVGVAEEKKGKTTTTSKKKEEEVKNEVKKEVKKEEDEQKILEKKREELNNTEWEISIAPYNENVYKESDTLYFFDNKIITKKLKEKGYLPSNYSLRIQPDKSFTWETMQSKEQGGDKVFWRGDIYGESMRGGFSEFKENGEKNHYIFSTRNWKKIKDLPEELKEKQKTEEKK